MLPSVRRAARAAACLFLVLSMGCGSDESRFAEHLARADGHAEAGRAKEAMIELRAALQVQPNSALANLRIAEVLVGGGEPKEAIFFYQEAQRLDPKSGDAFLGEALLVLFEDPDRAEELVEKALAQDAGNAEAHAVRADLALVRGDTKTALAAALTAVELEPDNADWHMQVGIVEQARIREEQAKEYKVSDRQFQRALRAFNKADELDETPGSWRATFQRAKVLAAWPGHGAEAPAAFRRAAEKASEAGDPAIELHALRTILDQARAMGDRELRVWALERLTETHPERLGHWRELAVMARIEKRSVQSIYERMLERLPGQVSAHLLFADAMASAGQVDRALAHLDSAETQVEDVAMLRAGRLDLLRSVGRRQEAEAALAQLEADFPTSPHTRLAKGQQALSQLRFDEAVEMLGGVANDTQSADAYRLLAQAELARGNAVAAVKAADAYLSQNPTDTAELLSLKARAQLRAGDASGALSTLVRLGRKERPLEPEERVLAARARYRMEQGTRARRILDQILEREDAPIDAALLFSRRESGEQPERARREIERMAAKFPNHEALQYELVRLDLATGRRAEAGARLEGLAARGRLTPALQLARAQLLASGGDEAGARRDVLAVVSKQPNLPTALSMLAVLHARSGDLAPAIQALESAGRDQLGPEALGVLGRLYLQSGATAKAEVLFEKSLAMEPERPSTQNDLAYLLADSGSDLDRALDLAKKAQSGLPEDPFVADTLGFVYLKRGLHPAAADQFRYAIERAALQKTPRPEFHHHLGLALRKLGRETAAAEAFDAALAMDPEFSGAAEARRQLEAARVAAAAAAAAESAAGGAEEPAPAS